MATIEIYSKDWCPYCNKAKALLRSRNLEFSEINITGDADTELEMIRRANRRTVPQIFINGSLVGGYDDLATLSESGELDELLGIETSAVKEKLYDVTIVGGGPAGMSAAIYAVRKNLSTLVVTGDMGGQLGTTSEISNYPGFQLISGPDLVEQFINHVDRYDIDKMTGESVTGINFEGRCKILQTASGKTIRTRTVIITTGAHKRELNIPGEKEFAGKGVAYCTTCDAPLFKGLPVAIIGGGNSALEAAIEMNDLSDKVYIISRGDWSGDPVLQDKVNSARNVEVFKFHEPAEIKGSERVETLVIKNLISGKRLNLPAQGVFIEIGLWPNTDFVLDLLETNNLGEIKVDARGYTGVRGIFAAGDATNTHSKQVVIAAGMGAAAALGAFEYLVSQI